MSNDAEDEEREDRSADESAEDAAEDAAEEQASAGASGASEEASSDDDDAAASESAPSENAAEEASTASDERSPAARPGAGKKKKKGKGKNKAKAAEESASATAKPKKSASQKEAPKRRDAAPPEEETPWVMVAIAVVVACAAVYGAYAWSHRGSSEDDVQTIDVEVEPSEAPPAEQADPFAAPPDVARPPANAQRTPSGLASRVLRPGHGTQHPGPTDRVTVHYTGWTTDGRMFDSSRRRGQPATFPLNGVIAGWTEGLQLMVPGEQRRFWIPEQLAYRGQPGRPQGMLVFDVELISIGH